MSKKPSRRSGAERDPQAGMLQQALVDGDKFREKGPKLALWIWGALLGFLTLVSTLVAILDGLRETKSERVTALISQAEHLKQRIDDTQDPSLLLGLEAEYQKTLAKIGELRDSMAWRELVAQEAPTSAPDAGSKTRAPNEPREPPGGPQPSVGPQGFAPIGPRPVPLGARPESESPVAAPRSAVRRSSGAPPLGGSAAPKQVQGPATRTVERPSAAVDTRSSEGPASTAVAPAELSDTWFQAGTLRLTLDTPALPNETGGRTERRHRELLRELQRLLR